jgi:branched-chain amino acid transport system permease protein
MDVVIQTVVQGILIGATYGIIALGMAVVYNISGIINFSHGDFVSLAMFLSLSLFAAWKLDPYVSVVITTPILFMLGALVYRFLIRPVADKHILMIVQLTLGLMFMAQNGLLMTYGGQYQRVPSVVEAGLVMPVDWLPIRLPLLIAFGVSGVMAGALYWMLMRTDFGRSIRSIHQNARAAALMGVDVERVRVITFAMGIALLAVAAALLIAGTPVHPSNGLRYTVTTLIVLVLGGMGNFAGVIIGGLIIGVAEALGAVYISGTLGFLVPYVIFVLILLFKPQGLLGGA